MNDIIVTPQPDIDLSVVSDGQEVSLSVQQPAIITVDVAVGGATDHGKLTGLNDDDHPQYHNDLRGDIRYSQLDHGHSTATTTTDGFMSATDKVKLDAVESNAYLLNRENHTGQQPISSVAMLQDSLDTKQNTITGAATTITSSNLTASMAMVTDTSGKVAAHGTVSATELGYLDGVTSAIQTQLNGKAATSHTHSNATTSIAGFMSAADKTKLDGIATGANNYAHPTGDGNLHVPATGTTNNGKVLTAGATAGSLSWLTPSLPVATSSVTGGVKLGSDVVQSITTSSAYSVAGKSYPLQLDSNGKAVINVPWTDTFLEPIKATIPDITVGSGGDFSTLGQAIAFAADKYSMGYVAGGANKTLVTIRLLSGFVLSEQIEIRNIDLGWLEIKSVDAEVVINRSTLTRSNEGYSAFYGENAVMPQIKTLFNMDSSGTAGNRHGIAINMNSFIHIENGFGVKNAGGIGLYLINSSRADASSAVFTGAGSDGLRVSGSSSAVASNANLSGCLGNGITVFGSSAVYAQNANLTNCTVGASVQGSSLLQAASANVAGCTSKGFYASSGAVIYCGDARIGAANSTNDCYVISGGIIAKAGIGGTNVAVNTVTSSGIIMGSAT